MKFEFKISCDEGVLYVYMKGFLDAVNAPGLLDEMKKYAGSNISKIVFDAKDLEYIASSGLRVIIFSKQKVGNDAEVVLKEPQEGVKAVFEMSGLINVITLE